MAKTVHIKTYGCQMNVYDSARMADVLAGLGFVPVDDADGADMVILNTCHIREKAAEKVYSELGRLRLLKDAKAKAGGRMVLAVAGCVAQAEGDEILARAPYVDLVVGPLTYHRLPELLAKLERETAGGEGDNTGASGHSVLDTDFPAESKFDHLPPASRVENNAAFLTVQEGCDKFCSFCVVPYTRGAEYSRPVSEVEAEARNLVSAGAREITLLGQNVNNYRGPGPDNYRGPGPDNYRGPRPGNYHGRGPLGGERGLGGLIRSLARIDGLDRIRYTTSYPADVDDDLIAAHRDVDELMPFLHLPVQSGSDRVLAAMNRRHTADDYRRLVARLRDARADLGLSSDFIVGFPGETEADFRATMGLAKEIGFIQAYSFKYSARPGTPAAVLDGQVPEDVKIERLAELQALLNDGQQAFNRACTGRVMPVLLDRRGRKPGQLVGRSPYMQPVHVSAPDTLLGAIVSLRIAAGHANSLSGVLADSERACA